MIRGYYSDLSKSGNTKLDNIIVEGNPKEDVQRISLLSKTEVKESALRCIEDVHNYSRLSRNGYSNVISNSSDENNNEDNEDLKRQVFRANFKIQQIFQVPSEGARNPEIKNCMEGDNICIKRVAQIDEISTCPDIQARRPMNAFLIFCKRHRAIVRDRYKSFENRAITKILGDWWASLDSSEKRCYTILAQQNKDAFFRANPNFQWYKLPAPPLRTLHTRPSIVERKNDLEETIPNFPQSNCEHVFKLADESQMGDLSALMGDKKNAIQQVLDATTQYSSIQTPHTEQYIGLDVRRRKSLHNDSRFSSSSTEEGTTQRKPSRLCKGKIYKELVNSGQIIAVSKRKYFKEDSGQTCNNHHVLLANANFTSSSIMNSIKSIQNSNTICGKNSRLSQDNNSPGNGALYFDLDEKVKELPALSLDVYLHRKHSIKKKNKSNTKIPNSTSSGRSHFTTTEIPLAKPTAAGIKSSQANQVVGSQKRKARKESITRQDVNKIENEVASFLLLKEDYTTISCNSCYYYSDISLFPTTDILVPSSASADYIQPWANNLANTLADEIASFSANISNNNNFSSTSDLLFLAEVATKTTESSKQ